ncbi:MAG: hypothetical protein ACTSU5_07935 [Promethearchaeota archaeon]
MGEHLFNYKRVPGGPTTNNSHELQYKQLEHLLRRAIGHSAANEYLLACGERPVFVNPGEAFEDIDAIIQEVDQGDARRQVAAGRKSREGLTYVVHDALGCTRRRNCGSRPCRARARRSETLIFQSLR